jgi:hypothetical protein
MTKSLSRQASGDLAKRSPTEDEATATYFTTLPRLVVDRANLPTTAKLLAGHLARAGNLFERASQVVRIVRGTEGERIEPLNPTAVLVEAHQVCRPVEERFRAGVLVREEVGLPPQVAKMYLALSGEWNLPILKGICSTPLLSNDGSINCSVGFDITSGLWCTGAESPPILSRPTFEDAQSAFRLIRMTFASFPFADSVRMNKDGISTVDPSRNPGADESAFLVGLMTAVCRPSLPLAPALLIRAPHLSGSGTGKGLLVRALSEIAFRHKPKAFTSRGDRQELNKRIEASLMQSDPTVFLDNCNHETLSSNFLAQVITEAEVSIRPLGQTKMVPLSTNAFIVVTGNAVQLAEDLTRRFLPVDLDPKCENPEQRRFDQKFDSAISAARSELLAAFLTIWRWGRQNRLDRGVPLGSFETWGAWCRDPLLALGCDDPVRRIADLKAQDPVRQRIADLFRAWDEAHSSTPVKFRDLDPRVRSLLEGNDQTRVARLQALENARAGGFVLEAIKPQGRWGKKKYRVRRDDA